MNSNSINNSCKGNINMNNIYNTNNNSGCGPGISYVGNEWNQNSKIVNSTIATVNNVEDSITFKNFIKKNSNKIINEEKNYFNNEFRFVYK